MEATSRAWVVTRTRHKPKSAFEKATKRPWLRNHPDHGVAGLWSEPQRRERYKSEA